MCSAGPGLKADVYSISYSMRRMLNIRIATKVAYYKDTNLHCTLEWAGLCYISAFGFSWNHFIFIALLKELFYVALSSSRTPASKSCLFSDIGASSMYNKPSINETFLQAKFPPFRRHNCTSKNPQRQQQMKKWKRKPRHSCSVTACFPEQEFNDIHVIGSGREKLLFSTSQQQSGPFFFSFLSWLDFFQ